MELLGGKIGAGKVGGGESIEQTTKDKVDTEKPRHQRLVFDSQIILRIRHEPKLFDWTLRVGPDGEETGVGGSAEADRPPAVENRLKQIRIHLI